MAKTTTQTTTQIPDDVRQYIPEILDALKRALATGDFEITIVYDNVTIKIPDIKVYLYDNLMRVIYKDIHIIYSNYSATVKVYKDPYGDPEVYHAHDYWVQLDEIHGLAIEKVKSRLEKILNQF
ncbi:MAG: hypothetical protein ACO2PN_28035 [Pyrobaculum sp.]|jgi:hypothetical protein